MIICILVLLLLKISIGIHKKLGVEVENDLSLFEIQLEIKKKSTHKFI